MISLNIKSDDYAEPSADYDASPCIYLNDDQVEALGIKGTPAPGTSFMATVRLVVRSVTATAEEPDEVETEGKGPDINLSLLVAEMEITGSGTKAADSLYGGA
jgi:hypothetical protein